MKELSRRILNGIRKVSAGLTPFGESVWPGVRNDLFVAHESIYYYASRFAAEESVLDAGCGTGYGSYLLATRGARSVLGIDLDRRNIRYARRQYSASNLTFSIADLENLDFPDSSFGFAIASNSLEHLIAPSRFLNSLRRMLRAQGRALIAVPPIYSELDFRTHSGIHYHRTNLTVTDWAHMIAEAGFVLSAVSHHSTKAPNFDSHLPSSLSQDDFVFARVPIDRLLNEPSITAMFLVESAAA